MVVITSTWQHASAWSTAVCVLFPHIQHQSCVFTRVWIANIALPANARKLKTLVIRVRTDEQNWLLSLKSCVPFLFMAVYIPFNRVSCGLQAAASISTQRSVYYFHRNLSGRTLPCYPVFFAVCSTMCVLLLTLCVVMCAARWGCVPHARSGRRVDTLVCVYDRRRRREPGRP